MLNVKRKTFGAINNSFHVPDFKNRQYHSD